MSYWDDLSPHAQALLRWAAHNEAKRDAPPTLARTIYPHLPSEKRAAGVEQPKPNAGIAETIYPNLRRR
jgi:hypothetical protein